MSATQQFYRELKSKFDVKAPNFLTTNSPITYVGLDISLTRQGKDSFISVDQSSDLQRYLDKIDFHTCRSVDNPMSNKWKSMENPTPLTGEEAGWYRAVVGSLNFYACATRYDIAYAVSRLAQFSSRPTVSSKVALERVLSYLKTHTAFNLTAKVSTTTNDIRIYSDSDHAGDKSFDCRSQSGTMIILNDAPVFWRSKKQPTTAIYK